MRAMSELPETTIARIDTNVKNLIARFDRLDSDVRELEKKKADKEVVQIIEVRLDKHLGEVDTIIATGILPIQEQVKENTYRISRIENRMIKWGGILIGAGAAFQIVWLFVQDYFKQLFI